MAVRIVGGVEARKPSQMREQNGLIIVCMGPSGAGKTSILTTLLEGGYGPLGVADIDGKAHVLSDHEDIDVFPAHTWSDIHKLNESLKQPSVAKQYGTWCWDNLTLMQAATHVNHGVAKIDNAMLRQSAYGKANVDMVSLAEDSRVLAERGLNIIFNIWSVRSLEEDTGITHIEPDITQTLLTRFIGIMDFVVYLEPAPPPKPYPPVMRTGGSLKYATKTAISPESPLNQLPEIIYQPSYSSILDAFHGAEWNVEKHKKR